MTADDRCWRCDAPGARALVCPRCEAPQPLDPAADYFALLGLPRRLVIDAEDLERRYHAAARSVHPDRHQTAGARAQALALAASAALNRAYRTLRDPVARGRYWLELHGHPLAGAGNGVLPALAALVFDVQEALDELRRRLAEMAYLDTLHADVAAALGG